MAATLLVIPACGGESGSDPSIARSPSEAPTPSDTPTPTPTRTSTPTPTPTPTETDGDRKEQRSNGNRRDGSGSPGDETTVLLRSGDEGRAVRNLQKSLEELRYWVGPVDGVYGPLTEQAVLAFQGAESLQRDGIFGPNPRRALKNASTPVPRDESGDHIEIDEARGLLMVVRGGEARWVFHTSTGTEEPYEHPSGETYLADTPNGEWTFTRKVDGWRDGRLGRLWRPRYFHEDGIAIHGYPVVPAYPASHGCARVSMSAIDFIWREDLAPMGSRVLVYGRS